MYPVSNYNLMRQAIRDDLVDCVWYGTITTESGTVYNFTDADIVEGSCTIQRSISSDSTLDIGTAYASELDVQFYMDVDRYLLYGATIDLNCKYQYKLGFDTWEDLGPFSWEDIQDSSWDSIRPSFHIEMGSFVIAETNRSMSKISVIAYDFMLKFDAVAVNDYADGSSNKKIAISGKQKRLPYQWIALLCESSGVVLGSTQTDIASLPNGNIQFTCDMSVMGGGMTARAMLMYISAVMGGFAYMGRDGKLYIDAYHSAPDDMLNAGQRYSSEFSDFVVYYTGLRATYAIDETIDYVKNTTKTGKDDGLVFDLGVNPFLQIGSSSQRIQVLQNIINRVAQLSYVPFNSDIPGNPVYDCGDVIGFTDGQASGLDYAAITDMTFRVNDQMTIKSTGENPEYVSSTGYRSSGSYNSSGSSSGEAWIETSIGTDIAIVTDELVELNAVTHTNSQNTEQKSGIQFLASYWKNDTSNVTAEVYFNDTLIASIKDTQDPGNRTFPINLAYDFDEEGENEVRVLLGGI